MTVCDRGNGGSKDTCDITLYKIFIMGLHLKPDIDSDISLSAVTDVFCILRDVTMCCITVGFNCVSIEGHQYGTVFVLCREHF